MYDKYQEEARAQLSELTSHLQNITGAMDYIETDMETLNLDEDALTKNIASESNELKKKKEEKTKIEMEWNSKSEEVTRAEIEINQLKQMSDTVLGIENDISFMTKDKEQKQNLYQTFEALFNEEELIQQNNSLFQQSRKDLEAQQKEQAVYMGLQSKLSEIELLISRYQVSMETQLNQKESEVSRYSELVQRLPSLLAEKERLDQALLNTQKLEEEIKSLQDQEIQLTSQISEAQILSELQKKEGLETADKMKLLEHSSSDMHTCPLCQSQLDESTTKKLKDSFQEEIHTKRMQFKENKELIDTLNENLISIKSNTENKTSLLENIRSELTTKITIINKQIEDSSNAESEITKLKKECDILHESLNKQDFLQQDQQTRRELITQIEVSIYDSKMLETLQQYLSDNQNHADLHTKLLSAKSQAPETKHQIDELSNRIIQKQQELSELAQKTKVGVY